MDHSNEYKESDLRTFLVKMPKTLEVINNDRENNWIGELSLAYKHYKI